MKNIQNKNAIWDEPIKTKLVPNKMNKPTYLLMPTYLPTYLFNLNLPT
jgi:hypothetical protein